MHSPVFFLLTTIAVAAAVDEACTSIGGTCQDDSKACHGSYFSGKCSGAGHIRCCTKTPEEHHTSDCSDVTIVSRDSWGARRPRSVSPLHVPVKDFFIHHTESGSCNSFSTCAAVMKSIQSFHMDDAAHHWSDIGYSFLVGGDGKIYEGRGWDTLGAHTQGYNSVGLAASFIGNFMTSAPNDASLNAVKALMQCAVTKGKLQSNYALFGHRDVGSTDCPGTALYNIIKTWPKFHAHPAK